MIRMNINNVHYKMMSYVRLSLQAYMFQLAAILWDLTLYCENY